MEAWFEPEFTSLDLGDERLDKRLRYILSAFNNDPSKTGPQAFKNGNDIKAFYEFFKNPKAKYEKILAPHVAETMKRIKEQPVVLLLNDTSVLNYTTKISMEGKGPVSRRNDGIFLHASLAITPERLNLGVLETNLWIRGVDYPSNPGSDRKKLPIEEKESLRWLQSYRNASKLVEETPETKVVYIADRECDIIEILDEAVNNRKLGKGAEVVIRVQHDRELDELDPSSSKKKYKKLLSTLAKQEALAEIEFVIPSGHGKKARRVVQKIRASSFKFREKEYSAGKVRSVSINVVMATEEDPPIGEKPLCWIILTTLPIDTSKNVEKIFEYYLCRWEIEIFFKILKSGCKIEERSLKSIDRMKPLIGFFIVLAWRMQHVMMLGRICPKISCRAVFEDSEWKSVFKIMYRDLEIPKEPPLLYDFIIMIARLGGYVPGKKAPPPGVKTMWKGMTKMADYSIAWQAFGPT